ncbi:MAG: nucleotidyltransferase [Lachnospiraceae bacterium]|nr:nucleotidyltransferase [Lachnospiraceae bacterium]
MSIVGIIAEFNPFHNGHKYMIEQAKKITGATNVVVVMSGNYVQRGTPAICNKHVRTKMAIESGCDVVIELPVVYSCGSAKYFAEGAINLLDSLGCIDYIAFGSEYSDSEYLTHIADILSKEPIYFKERLNHYLKNGFSYPYSRENALYDYLLSTDKDYNENSFRNVMSSPNCILAIEYMCAIKKFDSKIKPVPITRVKASYHQLTIQDDICSATALRYIMNKFDNIIEARNTIPNSVYTILKEEYNKSLPIYEDDFSSMLGYAIIYNKEDLQDYYDFSLTFANRVRNLSDKYSSFTDFSSVLTTKNVTGTYVNRCLTHLILGIKDSFVKRVMSEGFNFYIRILGFNKSNSEVLNHIKTNSKLPVITKISNSYEQLPIIGKQLLDINIRADEIYRYIQNIKFKSNISNEYKQGLYIKK